ncbi:dTMP kinase [Paenibacillus protaetiae]|uniref:Thymidylate kinase n=1 Tax=Paenibacillus protaetiae TaxID=2509456 RepID=A0A4V0YFF0_9BACL|nr:dTMP kinase [Paenibacillus protaetiae]QAY67481.1 dTMP kinase [Paenibacillus protaetiae]
MDKGIFITIEGGEGAGKTTLIDRLAHTMQERGRKMMITREPGGIPIAEQIRAVILDKQNTAMDSKTEALLYAASRRQHLVEKVLPALQQGYMVICDRFVDSSIAYQGYARGLDVEQIWSINRFAIGEMMPSLTLYMDIPPEVGLARVRKASEQDDREVNRLDLEANSFHERVREGYLKLTADFPDRIVKIDANRPEDAVFYEILSIIDERCAGNDIMSVKKDNEG